MLIEHRKILLKFLKMKPTEEVTEGTWESVDHDGLLSQQ